jgi:hypothetical protein
VTACEPASTGRFTPRPATFTFSPSSVTFRFGKSPPPAAVTVMTTDPMRAASPCTSVCAVALAFTNGSGALDARTVLATLL